MATERPTSQFGRPSRTQKALISVLGGLSIFAAPDIYGVAAGDHNDRVREARAAKVQKVNIPDNQVTKVPEADIFDITRAKVVQVVDR